MSQRAYDVATACSACGQETPDHLFQLTHEPAPAQPVRLCPYGDENRAVQIDAADAQRAAKLLHRPPILQREHDELVVHDQSAIWGDGAAIWLPSGHCPVTPPPPPQIRRDYCLVCLGGIFLGLYLGWLVAQVATFFSQPADGLWTAFKHVVGVEP